MTTEEYAQLESLLQKLSNEFRRKVSLTPAYKGQEAWIGVFDELGHLKPVAHGETLEIAALELKKKIEKNQSSML